MRICICEDDAVWRERCHEMLTAYFKKDATPFDVCEFPSGDKLIFEAEEIAPSIDILFLDIAMPGTNGLTVAEKIKSFGFTGVTVFLTNSGTHYADAFDLRAFNYIEKSASDLRFEKVLSAAVQEVADKNAHMLSLTCAGVTKNLRIDTIQYFEVRHDLITVYYGDNDSFEFYSTLDRLEERLFGQDFYRVQRSFLANLRRVKEKKSGALTMENGAVINISRGKNEEVTRLLQELHKL